MDNINTRSDSKSGSNASSGRMAVSAQQLWAAEYDRPRLTFLVRPPNNGAARLVGRATNGWARAGRQTGPHS